MDLWRHWRHRSTPQAIILCVNFMELELRIFYRSGIEIVDRTVERV
jgi:hypothetical protein